MALDIVAAVYHNGFRKVLEANLGFKNYDTSKFFMRYLTQRSQFIKKCQKVI